MQQNILEEQQLENGKKKEFWTLSELITHYSILTEDMILIHTILTKIFPHVSSISSNKGICYCRVSSKHQQDDLDRQIKFMQEQYPNYEIIKDIGSGINFKRPGLLKLIKKSIDRDISLGCP